MSRLSALLFLAIMASAFLLVRTQYESRALTTELDRAQREARRLEIENDKLDVERRAQALQRLGREVAAGLVGVGNDLFDGQQHIGPPRAFGSRRFGIEVHIGHQGGQTAAKATAFGFLFHQAVSLRLAIGWRERSSSASER